MESLATNRPDYAPGSIVHVTGTGFAPGCDVVVRITRPDGLVVIGDGSDTPGSDTVTTDLFGNLAYDYQLDSFPAVEGTYTIDSLGLADSVLAHMTFTDANNDANIAPEWAPGNTATNFNTLYKVTAGGTVQHVRITLPSGYTNISAGATAFSSGTWGTPVVNQANRTIDVSLTSGTGVAIGGWARIDLTATTPASQNSNAARWLLQTFTNTAGTAGEQNDNPPVLVNDTTNPSAAVSFVDASGNPITNPVLQNNVASTVRVRITQSGSGIKYVDVAIPTCFSSPTGVTTTVSTGGNGGYAPVVTDGFIRMPSGSIPTNGFLTVQFTTTPQCTSGVYTVTTSPATNATNPPSGTNQSVSETGGSLTVAAGLADLSITKTDSPDPVATGGTLTYTLNVSNAGPDDASAVKVVDPLPAGTTFVSATGTNWSCSNVSGTVTCNRTGGNLAPGAAPAITIVVTAPTGAKRTISNSATVSSPNDNTAANNTATATTVVDNPPTATVSLNDHSPKTNDTLTATATKTDIDGDAVTLTYVWKVNGVVKKTTSGSSSLTDTFDLSQSGNGSKSDTVTVEVTPTDAPGLNGSAVSDSATIQNTAPTVTLSGANSLSVNEGSTQTYNYSISDPDGDTIASVNTSCGANGTKVAASDSFTNTSGSFQCTFPDGPASSTISAQATDSGFGAAAGNTATQSVTVNNVAPSIAISGNPSVNEGSAYSLTLGTVSDPGTDTVSSYVVHWGDGSTNTYSSNGAKSHTYADGPNDYAITVDLVDEDGTFLNRANAFSVHVNNVAPSIAISGAANVNEGSPYSLTLGAVTDPGTDTVSSYVVHWGDGSSNTYTSNGAKSHTYADGANDYAITVDLVDEDGTFLDRANPLSVHVNNVAPSISISGNASVNEGSPYSLTLGAVTDPGTDTVSSYIVHWGDGSSSTYSSNGAKSHTYADGPNDYAITVDLVDEDGTFLNRANPLSVHVSNVPPSLTAAGNQSTSEGSSHSFSIGSFTDSGSDNPWQVSVDWGDGSFATVFTVGSPGTIPAQSHTYADGPNDYTVNVTVTDKDGASDSKTFSVHVNNVAPSIAISGNASVNEGSAYSLTLGAVTDPGTDTVSSYVVHWGDGSSNTYATNGAKSHTYADGPNDYAITVDLVDEDGTFANAANPLSVHVNNVAPSIAISGSSNVDEGSPYSLSLGAVSDPGADTVSSYVVHWGDGSSDTYGSNGAKSHTYADGPSDHAITVDLVDEDGTYLDRANALSVHVNNVVPSIAISGNASVNEGSAYSLTLGAVSDPGSDTVSSYVVHWGDGQSDTYSSNGPKSHTYADGPNDRAITVDLVDEDGTFTDRANPLSVHVNNVAPSISISGAASVNEGSAYSLTLGAVSDPGADTVSSYVVHWGDGQSDAYGSNGSKSHTYADGPSDHNVTVDLVDEDGTYLDRANPLSVHVNNVAPSIAISGNANVDEGSAYNLTLGAVSDPGADTVSSYVVHWGDGSTDTYSSNGVKSHTYADGPSDHAITVDLVDEDGSYSDRANPLSVHVNNVAPSIAISGNANVNEGSAYTLNLGAVTDPGADTVSSYIVHWGDGSSDTYASNGAKSHTYADGPSDHAITVDLVDEDGTFLDRANPFSVHVDNVAPTAHVTGPATVDEGTTHTYTFTVSDPGDDTFSVNAGYPNCGTGGNYVSGSLSTDAHGGSFDCSFPDGPASTDVKIKVTDSDGASDIGSESVQVVQVANVAPVVTAPADQSSNEGSSHSFDLGSFTDPGADSPWHVTVDWNDGSFNSTFDVASPGTIPAQSHTYADGPSDHVVTVTVDDGTDHTSKTFGVHVDNVAPSIAISGNANVDEGSAYTLNLGAVTDPGADTVSSYVVHWGDGSSDTYASNGAKSHTYADGPSDHAITVDLVDEDGTFANAANALSVHVVNVAPSINISGNSNVDEGSAYSLNLGAVTDPGADTVSSYVVHWGDGSSDTYSSNGAKSHTYADGPNSYDISVDLVDEDGTYLNRANAFSVAVNNVVPSIAISGDASVNEGSPYSLNLGSVSDPGTDTVSSYIVHWGDGSTDTYGSNGARSHTYADGPSDHSITVDLVDEDGTFTDRANAFSVHVDNVRPSIAISGNANVNEGSAYTLNLGAVTDPGADTVSSYVVHWGDGSTDTYGSNGAKSHTYADGPSDHSITVDLVDEDGTHLDRANAFSVHVDNVAPNAQISGPASVDEGTTHTYTFTVSDPGDDTFSVNSGYPNCGAAGSYVSGSLALTAHGGSFDCFFPNGPASTDVKIKVTDSDGASDLDSESVQVVQVANVAPVVTAPADQSSNEGSSHSFDLGSFSDPGDDSPWHVTVDWGDGSFATSFDVNSSGSIPAQSHTYADGPSDHTVTVTVDDGTDHTSKTFAVHVNNVAPSIAISGNANVDEGSAYSLTLGAVTDPGQDTVSSYVVHWGDGQSDTYASNGVKTHTYADGPNNYDVSVDLVDEDGTFTNAANPLSVHVENVAPSISISGNSNVDEGSAYSLNLGAVTDPGQDTVSSYVVHWGDGQSDTYSSNGVKTHTYADGPSDHAVTVDLIDEDGTYLDRANPFSVHVNNVVPTIAISGDSSVDEGSSYSLNLGAVTDPGQDTVSSYVVHWGDGSSDTYGSNGVKTHTYADGPSDHAITVDLVDEDGTFTDRANPLSVHVNNVAPSIAISGNSNVNEGSPYSLSLGAVSDPGTDTVSSYIVHWGDGSSDTYASNGAKSHTYADGPNDYSITVDLVDEDGSYANAANALSVHVDNVAPTAHVSGAANVDEGTTHTYSFTVSDPGDDTFSVNSGYPNCGSGGTYVAGSLATTAHGGSFDCFFPNGPATTNVSIRVTDSDGASDTASESVQVVDVANVPPTVTPPANQSSNEGENHSFSLGSFTDPGADSPWHVSVNWGDGSAATAFDMTSPGTIPAHAHTYADGPNDYTVTVSVNDHTDTTSQTFSVHVNNVAPTVTLAPANDLSVNEGSSHTYSYTISDPGQDTVSSVATSCGANGNKVPLSDTHTDTNGSFGCTFPDGDASSTVSVQATDSDNDAGNTDTQSVTIHNVAPSIAISGNASVNEGSPYSLSLGAVTDPGTDTVSSYVVHWGDGQSDTYSANGAKSHTYADGPSDHNITVDLVDEDGTFLDRANPLSVHVVNVAPSVSFTSSPASASEGQTKTYSYTISDPGQDTVSAVHPNCGGGGTLGNASNTDTSGSFDCTFPDGPASSTVSISATDSDGDTGNTDSQSVSVANVPPSIAISGNASVNEGSAYSLNLGAVSDPGQDTVSSYVVHWGDGQSDTYTTNGSKSHTYADGPNDYNITVDLVDEDGTFLDRANPLSVHINNVAPTAQVSGPANVDEGTTHTYTFTVSDPGDDTFSVNSGYPNCGSGGTYVAGSLATTAHGGSFDCFFPNGPVTTNVSIKVTDSDGASDTASESVQVVDVANVPPSVTAPANQSSNEGENHSFNLGSFSDPGADSPWHVSVNWGDGSAATTFNMASPGTIPAQSHTYADGPNDYTVTVSVNDNTDTTSNTFSVHVNNVAPTIAISGNPSVNEGSAYSLTLGAVTDPGQDTVSSYIVHWGDGSSDTYSSDGAKSHTYADGPDDHSITVDLVDEDGTYLDRANALSVHVNNVAPTVHLTGDATADEGTTHTYTYTVTDPGQDTFTVNAGYPQCGSGGQLMLGSVAQTPTGGSFDCFFPNGPATTNVSAKVTDSDGASDIGSESVQVVDVANVPPSVTAPANQSSNEGENHSFSLGSFTDPGADSPWHVTVAWGDGSLATTFDMTSPGTIPAHAHTYADGPNDYTVTVSVNDNTDTTSKTFSVHVNNVAPSVHLSAGNDLSVNEGTSHTYSYTISDPGQDTVQSVAVDCGAHGSLVAFSESHTNAAGSFGCSFPDGDAGSTVSVQASDSDSAAGNTDTQSVTIHDVAPSIAISGNASVNEGSAYSLTLGAVSDPGQDTVSSYIVHWGDGSSDTYASNGAKSHTYADGPNDYAITVDLVNEDGSFANAANPLSVHVNNVAPSVSFTSSPASANEGQTKTYSYSISDPGQDTVSAVHPSCGGNGNLSNASNTNASGSFDCTFPDGAASSTVSVSATDSDGDTGNTASQSVSIANVPPSIAISGNASVNEGSAYSLTLGAVSDPGQDTVSSYIVHWGDGSSNTYSANGAKSHTYADGPNDYAITVDLVDEDGTFLDRANPLSVHVNNVAPTAQVSGPANVDEGTTHTYSFTVSDPGDDTFSVNSGYPNCGAGGQYVAGSLATTAHGGSFDCFFPNGPVTTNVSIKVTDSDGASDTASESVQVVDVANIAPSVTAPANQSSNEGENHSFSLGSFTDPGADSPWHVTVAWGDGSPVTTFDVTSAGSLGTKAHVYADGPNDYTVTVTVNDGTDNGSATFAVHVNNVPPTVTLSGPLNVAEGSTATYSYTTSDPGTETFTRVAQGCGAGGTLSNASFNPTTGAGSFDCKWDDGPGSGSPNVTVSDGDGGSDSKSLAVTVNNVAPTATFSNNGPVNEGQSFTLTLSSPQDPSSADTAAGFQYAFDCGSGSGYGAFGASNTATCPTTDSGSRAVKGKIKDKDGGVTEYTGSVTVNNVAPSATFANNGPVNEGSSFTLSLTNPSDPSSVDTTAGFQYAFDCGSGTYSAYSSSSTATCPTNDNGVRSVKGKIKDKDGGERVYTGSVTVNNVAPVVTVTSPSYGSLYAKNGTSNPTVTTTATFTDAGTADTHTCSIAWDDGTTSAGTVTESNGSGTCTASHTYTGAGVYTYHVTVTDDDGGSSTVDWEVVVYDASAGFVTGGGWINVQPGSYPADPTLGGRANFGFNSKYTKNGGPPQGETEFNFQVGNFNFHSDVYTVLIVSSFKSQYRGSGSVNGVPGYDFSLTAYDGDIGGGGGVDKFRIRITLHNNGNVVFDNRITNGNTDMDTADPQAIAGGSIVIHKA